MSFLTPIFLLLGLLAAPILILYMLRLRRREMLVSSTLLWQKLLRDREANAPWQKLRRNLLLLLQLLILAALVLALARPFIPVPSVVSGSVVILLDGSASMQATDVTPTRFAAAQAEVNRWISDLGAGHQMTLILAGPTPTVLAPATADRNLLRQAVAAAQPAPAGTDWAAALALAAGAAQGARNARIVIVSDGGLPSNLPPLPAETIYIPIGSSAENLAISALATRDTPDGPQLFASVANHGTLNQEALFSLSLGETLFDSRRISIPAGQTTNLTWTLPNTLAGPLTARLSDQSQDNLPLDDVAWAVHEGGVSNRALLVTPGNLFLEQIYGVLPGIQAFKAPPDTDLAAPDAEPFDLYVLDSVPLPDPLPAGDLLIINPQPGSSPASTAGSLLAVTGTFSNTTVTGLANSPLLQFVDWSGVHIQQAQSVSAPWAQAIVSAAGGPLLLAGERGGQRIAILTFQLQASDLPLQIAFPVLMANITSWLSPGRAFDIPASLQSGDPVSITPGASTTSVLVDKPDGTTWSAEVGEEQIIFSETDQPGLYTVRLRDAAGDVPAGQFAVNLFAPAESAIRPAPVIRLGQQELAQDNQADIGQRELWPWLLALAILVLVVEWWVHFRGVRLPRPGKI